jgi:hypothetical protein
MRKSICAIVIILFIAVLLSGCTQQKESSSGTGASQAESSVTSASGSEAGSMEEYPAPPVDNAVSAQINDKDQLDKKIHVFFSGGKGQKMVKSSWIVMKRSDGKIERFSLKPEVQSEVILDGTDGPDLVRVYAEYFDGNIYQIAERTLKLRQRI